MKKLKKKLSKFFSEITLSVKRHAQNKVAGFMFLNITLFLFQIVYISFRHKYLTDLIPLWYTRPWGDYQLASKDYIFAIPLTSFFISITGLLIIAILNKYFVRYITDVISIMIVFFNALLVYQLLRIFSISTIPYDHFINPVYVSLIPYFIFAYLLSNYVLPFFISIMRDYGIVTNPNIHNHPSMLLRGPSARGGGVLFTFLFLSLATLFVGFSRDFIGFYISLLLVGVLSLLDDYQNTHPTSVFKVLENPFLRLLLLASAVSITVMSGFKFDSIINPLQSFVNGVSIDLNSFGLLSAFLTVVWIVWFMNVLSWSNGVDGQYSGIVGIAFIIVAILSLRFEHLDMFHKRLAILAIISAGLSFGTVRHMWHPSKVMWGFGAVSAGLVLAVLAFLSQSKVITSVLIILIPFLDALVTLFRRLFQGKNPLKGDKNHLHHILLRKGWDIPRIALFYWITTAVFGLIGLLTAEILSIQFGLIIAGIVAFIIVALNLNYIVKKDENNIHQR